MRDLWQYRNLLRALAGRDVKLRYKQTALGVVWVLLQPLLAAGIFAFVFGTIAGLQAGETTPYFMFSYAGLLGWSFFSNTLARSSSSLVGNSQLISKIFFPRMVLPLSTIPSALIDLAIATVMMAVLMWVYRVMPGGKVVLLPLWLLLLTMLSAGVGLWTSALTVSYRDVQHIMPVLLQMLLYASPVAYPVSKVPERWMDVYQLNPLVSAISGMRWSLLPDADAPQWRFVILAAGTASAVLISGALAFKRMERRFADII